MEAQEAISRIASLLAASHSVSKSMATAYIYVRFKPDPNQVSGYPGQGSKAKIDITVLISNFLVYGLFMLINQIRKASHNNTCVIYMFACEIITLT